MAELPFRKVEAEPSQEKETGREKIKKDLSEKFDEIARETAKEIAAESGLIAPTSEEELKEMDIKRMEETIGAEEKAAKEVIEGLLEDIEDKREELIERAAENILLAPPEEMTDLSEEMLKAQIEAELTKEK